MNMGNPPYFSLLDIYQSIFNTVRTVWYRAYRDTKLTRQGTRVDEKGSCYGVQLTTSMPDRYRRACMALLGPNVDAWGNTDNDTAYHDLFEGRISPSSKGGRFNHTLYAISQVDESALIKAARLLQETYARSANNYRKGFEENVALSDEQINVIKESLTSFVTDKLYNDKDGVSILKTICDFFPKDSAGKVVLNENVEIAFQIYTAIIYCATSCYIRQNFGSTDINGKDGVERAEHLDDTIKKYINQIKTETPRKTKQAEDAAVPPPSLDPEKELQIVEGAIRDLDLQEMEAELGAHMLHELSGILYANIEEDKLSEEEIDRIKDIYSNYYELVPSRILNKMNEFLDGMRGKKKSEVVIWLAVYDLLKELFQQRRFGKDLGKDYANMRDLNKILEGKETYKGL